MRRLDFEFAGTRRKEPLIGWLLLLAGVLLAADAGRNYVAAMQEVRRLETDMGKRHSVRAQEKKPARATSREEIAEARGVLARFATPWPALFDALESVRVDEVALLAIEPDAASYSVVISGEARNYLAVLTYVARLNEQPALSRVHLARHEQRDAAGARRPVAFSVAAQWRRM